MKRLFVRATRVLLLKTIGLERLERMLTWFARGVGINLLLLGYRSVGVLKWEDFFVSGEKFLIDEARKAGVWPDNPVLFDVGANLGDYSRTLVETFPKGRVYAFEPNSHTFQILKRNLNGGNVTCVPAGLGSRAGTETLYVYPEDLHSGHASRSAEVFTIQYGCTEPERVSFTMTTLDSFCEEHDIRNIQLLKIDTEGYELEVLKGAEGMLKRNGIDMIQFEFGECSVFTRVFLIDFYVLLPEYNFYRLNTNELIRLGKYNARHEIFRFQNILAVNKNVSFPP